jgi:hypothetical protein
MKITLTDKKVEIHFLAKLCFKTVLITKELYPYEHPIYPETGGREIPTS